MKKAFIIILVIIFGVYGVYMIFKSSVSEKFVDTTLNTITQDGPNTSIEIEKVERTPSQFACVGEFCDGSGETDIPDERTTTTVMIPLVKQGGTVGCGVDIFYAPHTVPKTLGVLDATYKLLFDIKSQPEIEVDGFWNTVGNYTQLDYKNVYIENDVLKVNLIGSLYGPGHCSLPELREQIVQTALYYKNINSVEVYLNGKLYDWCEQDESSGEGSCPENPDYWKVDRNSLQKTEMIIVKIPQFIMSPESRYGEIEYKKVQVPKTTAVLDASYKAFFNSQKVKGSYFELSFDRVSMLNATAKVYLKGSLQGIAGIGSYTQIQAEIPAVAFQFDTVDRVEFYLNGKAFDKCLLGQNDECQFNQWIEQK